ncbi:hypothetical protein [Megalodesulfovibrio gigas]|uniref:Uncharacterized protein n=1 Tax=Megalodesulfovibrio gigas (strain ATCC 19364 / DSM 1382 / NCIMB 9332 / VKM B-1759) TaxID=1121448 RepID=T2GG16_MEGG1|nr:hypothetical protein [Megalodesulfovibrio gigas]AGW15101.1 hypothetical protein DGI_3419 [Megalodesulfovibrio gigas DSM 1382 = ATCC 19364]
MTNSSSLVDVEAIQDFFSSKLSRLLQDEKWEYDRQWTDAIHKHMAGIGKKRGLLVYASKSRCAEADGPEWLYDHHWRVQNEDGALVSTPLVMEIEWGNDEKIIEDFLKLVQARAALRVMVFQRNDVEGMIERLIAMAKTFDGSQRGDKWIFAGWDKARMHCELHVL